MDTPKHDVLTIFGDFNAKVGSTNIGSEEVMGKHGLGEINNNGERLVEMCTMNNLVIGGTIFEHKNIHKATWVSPNGKVKNQIDHILINKKWRSSLIDVKVKRGADVYSDHHLVIGKIRLKLRKNRYKTPSKIIDFGKLKQPEIQQNFNIELKNRFEVLQLEENEIDINSKWQHMSEIYLKTSEDILGYKNKERKEWISDKTWALIMERKVLKSKTNQATAEQQEGMKDLYNSKEKEVKKNAKADKKAYIDKIAEEAENASKVGDMRKLYNITKQLSGRVNTNSTNIKDKDGQTICKFEKQLKRWKEHFEEVLNRPEPEISVDRTEEAPPPIEIEMGPITDDEIKAAIKKLKNNKAPGVDGIPAEVLKSDINLNVNILRDLLNEIWEKEILPTQWKDGIIIKLPKKG
ncbi:uncharacterized protein LOC143074160 [Mytilus galloprovincialis]|uniref:uncharacterized protein LOC143074160 n=1 Tax=Mytilus galloprovincialis TaxID=29158 RepID=UPI003F7B7ABF